MDIHPIRTDADHDAAVREIERLMEGDPALDTPEGARLDALVTLVEAYAAKRWPIEPGDPIDVLHHAIEDMGRTQAELATLLGSASRASEVLNRRRPLTVEMIHKISAAWGLPAALLVRPYELAKPEPRRRPQATAGHANKGQPGNMAFPNVRHGTIFAMATKPPPGLKRPQVQRRQKGK